MVASALTGRGPQRMRRCGVYKRTWFTARFSQGRLSALAGQEGRWADQLLAGCAGRQTREVGSAGQDRAGQDKTSSPGRCRAGCGRTNKQSWPASGLRCLAVLLTRVGRQHEWAPYGDDANLSILASIGQLASDQRLLCWCSLAATGSVSPRSSRLGVFKARRGCRESVRGRAGGRRATLGTAGRVVDVVDQKARTRLHASVPARFAVAPINF